MLPNMATRISGASAWWDQRQAAPRFKRDKPVISVPFLYPLRHASSTICLCHLFIDTNLLMYPELSYPLARSLRSYFFISRMKKGHERPWSRESIDIIQRYEHYWIFRAIVGISHLCYYPLYYVILYSPLYYIDSYFIINRNFRRLSLPSISLSFVETLSTMMFEPVE